MDFEKLKEKVKDYGAGIFWLVLIVGGIWFSFSGDSSSSGSVSGSSYSDYYGGYSDYEYDDYEDDYDFYGYDCTYDCSGHDAGYEWAEENDIDDPDDCDGKSNSFIEGCEAFAEEQQEDYWEEEYEDDYYNDYSWY